MLRCVIKGRLPIHANPPDRCTGLAMPGRVTVLISLSGAHVKGAAEYVIRSLHIQAVCGPPGCCRTAPVSCGSTEWQKAHPPRPSMRGLQALGR